MVLTFSECLEISKKIEMFKLSVVTFGYDICILDRTSRIPSKLQ